MSKKAVILYAGFFVLGLAAGVLTYLDYLAGDKAVEAAVAGTNAIPLHVGIAVLLVVGIVLINRRMRQNRAKGIKQGIISGDGGFWKAPFTQKGWQRLLFALISLPVGAFTCFISLGGGEKAALKIERWRLKRYLGVGISPIVNSKSATTRYFLVSLPLSIVQCIAGYMAIFTVWRAGLQVVGAFDPNFCINAWGGPTYLGASGAHWMDAFVIFFASIVVVRYVSSTQAKLAVRMLGKA